MEMGTVTLESIKRDIKKLSADIELIKNILIEKYELSDWAKNELKKARETPENEYVGINEII
ncbi:MAG: hypothetical protein DRO95_06305 [Candidatus Altiarchaeales archaeon]|nr:MAG: hypothetical protein DRO95_06305 [Candidatus Altiarchaeales archaeon]